ncbi:MAG: L-seryl-tRNA(Sec) selenium transferase [Spirochaetia bacterium]|jgi:L-seryl-tRNA(Ser) seleniumtransferase|uniref:L-seryl-tRNA(Sec) selenium transferase n=1 Tax=bioreactor metagenome TaxID=1076179 RepID=A0A644UI47_9ZZZZ|nr:L-seryl-tRNA(Sec) selenium transferase [Spirochaetia bacterium]MCE1210110.1 L-seryl-tRNA(Sec) selenium transferase [Spirochaetia bacterium]VBB40073.1 L-seryl-tRNA(Sec) selenium transferase [uncultured Spirochaetota bacterium]
MKKNDPRGWIPQVEHLLVDPGLSVHIAGLSRPLAARTIAQVLDALRGQLSTPNAPESLDQREVRRIALEECRKALEKKSRRALTKVFNGTGVVLHTNLGRSPIPPALWEAVRDVNTGYSNLEFDVETGQRGLRGGLAPELLATLVGAEAGLAVNNNAAAVLLILKAFAKGREVIVSRGEAVQIGGGFRIPDILALSGAVLKEVGTTNITTTQDYLNAISPDTAAILLVHSSNFVLRGFTEKPSLSALSKALPPTILRIVDQGSGSTTEELESEPSAAGLLRAGADLVCFSGDKLLGGPQAGLIVGRADLIATLSRHPLMRAFRPGKIILSLLEANLLAKLGGGAPSVPETSASGIAALGSAAQKALALSAEPGLKTLRSLARKITRTLPKDRIALLRSRGALGGGSTPDQTFPSLALGISPLRSAESLSAGLRQAPLPLVARIENEKIIIDLITLADEDPRQVADTIAFALEHELERENESEGAKTAKHAERRRSRPGGSS